MRYKLSVIFFENPQIRQHTQKKFRNIPILQDTNALFSRYCFINSYKPECNAFMWTIFFKLDLQIPQMWWSTACIAYLQAWNTGSWIAIFCKIQSKKLWWALFDKFFRKGLRFLVHLFELCVHNPLLSIMIGFWYLVRV